jgi:hypothetical protein
MKKLIVLLSASMLLITACGGLEEGTFKNVKVVSKHEERKGYCNRGSGCFIVVEKNGEQSELKVGSVNQYRAIKRGSTIDVTYDTNYAVLDVKFKKLESN